MAVTMNIDSATWTGQVTFAGEAILDWDFGGDVVEHSTGADSHISSSQIVNIRGLYTIGFNDRATFVNLSTRIGTEASMTLQLKDIHASTGQQIVIANSRLQRLLTNAQHNSPTVYSAVFYARSSDGSTSPVTASAY